MALNRHICYLTSELPQIQEESKPKYMPRYMRPLEAPGYNARLVSISYILTMKYDLPNHEGEILPNKLGLTDLTEIQKAEYRGFLKAEIAFEAELVNIGSF